VIPRGDFDRESMNNFFATILSKQGSINIDGKSGNVTMKFPQTMMSSHGAGASGKMPTAQPSVSAVPSASGMPSGINSYMPELLAGAGAGGAEVPNIGPGFTGAVNPPARQPIDTGEFRGAINPPDISGGVESPSNRMAYILASAAKSVGPEGSVGRGIGEGVTGYVQNQWMRENIAMNQALRNKGIAEAAGIRASARGGELSWEEKMKTKSAFQGTDYINSEDFAGDIEEGIQSEEFRNRLLDQGVDVFNPDVLQKRIILERGERGYRSLINSGATDIEVSREGNTWVYKFKTREGNMREKRLGN
jgi:hypothetical protein